MKLVQTKKLSEPFPSGSPRACTTSQWSVGMAGSEYADFTSNVTTGATPGTPAFAL